MKVRENKPISLELAKQNCNFYKLKLNDLSDLNMDDFSSEEKTDVLNKMKYFAFLIDIYSMESLEEWLYLPTEKIRLKSIQDLMYFESLYGYTIYEKKEYS